MYCQRCKDKNYLIDCACGCGGIRALRTKWGDICTSLIGHRKRSDEGTEFYNKVHNRYYVKKPNHPRADASGRVRRAWIVYEESHNCCLLPGVNVHHRDGDETNDVWYNLEALWRWQHTCRENIRRSWDIY